MNNLNTKKRAGEMYAFLIGTIIGLLIIGAMFFGYGIYKSGTSNSQIFTAVQNGDINKLSSLRLNNKIPVNTDKIVVFKRGDNTVDLSTLTDTGIAYTYVVSNDLAVSEGVITKQEFFALDDKTIISKGFITPGISTERIPKYFGVPNSSTISGYTVFETSDTAYFSNTIAFVPQTPAPPNYTPENCFTFSVGNITGYDKNLCGNNVNIPPTIGGINVDTIGGWAFWGLHLSSVIIPEGVVTISDSAFYGNDFTGVIIPNSVTSIGNDTFSGNSFLTEINLGSGVQTIGTAFINTSIASVYFPDSLTSISSYAFQGSPLAQVDIGDNVSLGVLVAWNEDFNSIYGGNGGIFSTSDGVHWIRN